MDARSSTIASRSAVSFFMRISPLLVRLIRFVQAFRLQVPYPHADGCSEGVVDHVVRFAPAHFEEVLGGLGGNVAHAADEDDALGFELWEQDQEDVVKRTVAENSKAGVSLRKYVDKNHSQALCFNSVSFSCIAHHSVHLR